jgi:hypothetical protein
MMDRPIYQRETCQRLRGIGFSRDRVRTGWVYLQKQNCCVDTAERCTVKPLPLSGAFNRGLNACISLLRSQSLIEAYGIEPCKGLTGVCWITGSPSIRCNHHFSKF